MAGIASTAGAPNVQHVVTRVLLRLTVLAGLVLGGWLLGSATGWADEEGAREDWGRHGADAVSLAEIPSPAPAATESRIEASTDSLLSVVQLTRLPVQPPVLETAAERLGEPALEPVLQPILDPVLREAIIPRIPSRAAVGDQPEPWAPTGALASTEAPVSVAPLRPTGPRTPAEPAAWVMNAPSTLVPKAALRQVVDAAADQFAGWSAGSAPPTPASPPRLATTSCPAGSTAASGTTRGVHAITLNDGCPGANLAVGQRQRYQRTAGLPGAPDQQPSTSPD